MHNSRRDNEAQFRVNYNYLFTIYRDIKGEQKTFTINSKHVILFHFESANIWTKIREKKILDPSSSKLYIPRGVKLLYIPRDVK